MKKPKILVIEWVDTHSEDTWNPIDLAGAMEPLYITSVGVVVKETKEKIVLSAMVSERDTVSMCQCIPTGCIVSTREIV